MNKKKRLYIAMAGSLLVLLTALLVIVYYYHSHHVEESPLYHIVSSYGESTQRWHPPQNVTYAEDSGEGIFLRGMGAFADEDYAAAKALFEQALGASGSDPALPAYLYFYINQCDVYLNGTGNAETVSLALDAVRHYAPLINDTDMLWDLIGSISLSTGNDAEAITLMEEHLEKSDHHMDLATWAWLKNCVALLHYNNQEYARSIRGFYDVELALEAAEMTPELKIEFRYAKEYIANIYNVFEDYEKATDMYQELIDMAMDDETFHAYASCINMATAYLEIPDVEKAREAIATLKECLPRVEEDIALGVEASMNDTLANICLKDGDTEAAAEYLGRAEAFYQTSQGNNAFLGPQYFTMLTRCKYLFQTGALEEAQQILETMITSGDAAYYGLEEDVYELLRDIYQIAGEKEKLLAVYEKLMELDVDFSKTIQREYLEFSAYYKENNDLIDFNTSLSRTNLIFTFIIITTLGILAIILILLRLLSTKNVTDQLTGVYNRKKLNQLLRSYKRTGTPGNLGVVMMDIDYFKRYNDTYGHPAGDEVLKQVAKVLVGSLRSKDIVIRYGGEEFLVLLNGVQGKTAEEACLRIHEQLKKRAIPHADSEASEYVTLSMGMCYQEQAGAATLDKLIEHADECLYQSKEAGRNRVTTKTV